MKNFSFFVGSLLLVWVLMTGYLGYLHLKILRLYEIMYDNEDSGD